MGTPKKTPGARYTLQSISGQMIAIIYRAGSRIGEYKLGEGIEVWQASKADKTHAPKKPPRLPGKSEIGLRFTGWYVIPGTGLAAIYGAKPPEK